MSNFIIFVIVLVVLIVVFKLVFGTSKIGSQYWIEKLELKKHPEGGMFSETYKADEFISKEALPKRFTKDHSFSTAIYFLLQDNDVSHFHRIKQDEIWHLYDGDDLEIHVIFPNGIYNVFILGKDKYVGGNPQIMIPKGSIFGACLKKPKGYVLVGCTVAPGFEFEDFELMDRNTLLEQYPWYSDIILKLTKNSNKKDNNYA